ncbi:MAG: hypothetical protein AAFR73_12185 [Pseudomonadota bacterium]
MSRAKGTASLILFVLMFAAAGGAAAQPDGVSVVVHRGGASVEVYFSLPADMLVSVFGMPRHELEGPDGRVDFDALRMGTWDIGDAAFRQVGARIGGQVASFEALSLMVHPKNSLLPLSTPIEGMISIAVCAAPTPRAAPALSDLQAYVGYIAYTDRPQAPIMLDLPETGRAAFTAQILDYTSFELRATSEVVVSDGGLMLLNTGTASQRTISLLFIGGALSLLVVFLVLGLRYAGCLRSPALRHSNTDVP